MENFIKIGHRGAKAHIAENTLESIIAALEMKVDMVEIDVHKCATGEIVVIHDFTLDRTTNGSGEVKKKSLSEIRELKVDQKYQIPLLEEVLDLLQDKCQINIELKGLNTAKPVSDLLHKNVSSGKWKYSEIIVSSFQKNELFQIRKENEEIPIGVLSKASVPEAIELGKLLKAKAIHPSLGIITRDNVKLSQNEGFKVNVWTVNEPEDISRMKEFGVDGIISDFPERL